MFVTNTMCGVIRLTHFLIILSSMLAWHGILGRKKNGNFISKFYVILSIVIV